MSKTDENLRTLYQGEADANRRYTFFAQQAMNEGYPEAAMRFLEAAGSETIHAQRFFELMGANRSTRENLEKSIDEEGAEIEEKYPRMIRQAREDGREDVARAIEMALNAERSHREMFRQVLHSVQSAR